MRLQDLLDLIKPFCHFNMNIFYFNYLDFKFLIRTEMK